VAGALEISQAEAARILSRLRVAGLVEAERPTVLTEEGQGYALRIIRTHRLLERYLADRTGVAPDEWHEVAERDEHHLSREAVEALDAGLGRPRYDPHGDPIPTASGDMPETVGVPLTHLEAGESGVITHLEDEPPELYRELVDRGLSPGMRIGVSGADLEGLEVVALGRSQRLPLSAAANVTVVVGDDGGLTGAPEWYGETLANLRLNDSAVVVGLSPACRGTQRRRLLDLGVVPGTVVRSELQAAGGDPAAFRIRGALIALRREQQEWVQVQISSEEAA
jgi:DtxR family Mn-dependent transcriptional regulator